MKINEKNLCSFAISHPVDLEGYLNKKGEVNKSYQKRWFVLKGNLLFYFERKGDREPIGVIIIEGCTVELAQDITEQYCFQIIFHGQNNRTYFLSAESQEIQERWLKALTCAGYEYMKLMVTELQRQLNEIEGNRGNTPKEQSPQAPPRPPPRRQNPFNRPAPSPPNQQQQQSTMIKDQVKLTTTSNSENLLDVTEQLPQGTTKTTTETTITSISSPITSSGSLTIPNDDNLFKIVHEEFGKPILQEMNERKYNNQVKEEPLIIF